MRLELPAPLLPLASRRQAARQLGLTLEELDRVARGDVAVRDGALLDEGAFFTKFPQDDFDDFTGEKALPAALLRRDLDVPRDPSKLLTPPITGRDRVAAAAWVGVRRLQRLVELKAPSILLRAAKRHLQTTQQPLDSSWQPLTELMTGASPSPRVAGEPSPFFALDAPEACAAPGEVAFVAGGFLVAWPYVSLVFDEGGVVRDVFPTRGLRVVGSTTRHVALVCGGGALADSPHFGGQLFVRDTHARTWLARGTAVPRGLPRYVAGTVTELKWAIVVDVVKGVGYRTAPLAAGDQAGETFNSACGRFVWDRERFVLRADTGKAVLDTLPVTGTTLGFAKAGRGWRFLMSEKVGDVARVLLKNEQGVTLRDLGPAHLTACALSADGARVVAVTASRLEVTRADSAAPVATWDLSGLGPALEVPAGEVHRRLAAVYGTPSLFVGQPLAALREAAARTPGERSGDAELRAALAEAKRRPALPLNVTPLPDPLPPRGRGRQRAQGSLKRATPSRAKLPR
jgi:hypothetical protein